MARLATHATTAIRSSKSKSKVKAKITFTVTVTAAVKLNDLVAPLDSNVEADKKLLADANKVGEALATRETAITKFLDPNASAPPPKKGE